MAHEPSSEAWKKMVLRSMPPPAWLETDAPEGDVVISSRFRAARNLVGYRFPHIAANDDLKAVQTQVERAVEQSPIPLESMRNLTEAERDYLLGSRLISSDFPHRAHGRQILLDRDRVVSIMVNEEDHVRLQCLTAGWSFWSAEETGRQILAHMADALPFMSDPTLGYLTASPTNLGGGQRRSALFHLIGLAHTKRLKRLIKSLGHLDIVCRGLFGESSLAVGAFVQISSTTGSPADFRGACTQVIREERMARREVRREELADKARQAADYAIASNEISMRDALLVLGWVRWASSVDLPGFRAAPRTVDLWSSRMEVYGTQDPKVAARQRAEFLRQRLESLD